MYIIYAHDTYKSLNELNITTDIIDLIINISRYLILRGTGYECGMMSAPPSVHLLLHPLSWRGGVGGE